MEIHFVQESKPHQRFVQKLNLESAWILANSSSAARFCAAAWCAQQGIQFNYHRQCPCSKKSGIPDSNDCHCQKPKSTSRNHKFVPYVWLTDWLRTSDLSHLIRWPNTLLYEESDGICIAIFHQLDVTNDWCYGHGILIHQSDRFWSFEGWVAPSPQPPALLSLLAPTGLVAVADSRRGEGTNVWRWRANMNK